MENHAVRAAPSPRQTLSFLADLFKRHGLRPKNKLGQNFLIDLNLIDVLLRAAELTREDLVVEVGTGTGSLTARLADEAGAVFSVELDPNFHALARANLGERPHVQLVHADILHNKNQLKPRVLDALSAFRAQHPRPRLKLVANLPYAVATPVISNFLLEDAYPFERMVVTVQWEIAERLWAQPGRKDYGALSVLVQSVADVQLVRRLGPAVFFPRPKVDSAIVLIRPNPERRAQAPDPHKLRIFLRDLYAHRRKNLRGGLVSMPALRGNKELVDRKLAELGVNGTVRAETLGIKEHWRLCETFAGASTGFEKTK
jgi:16S rRNA (adenine1518-N6/adenine1519-N6)-dimethyltransferase